jgi:hypothetical protein
MDYISFRIDGGIYSLHGVQFEIVLSVLRLFVLRSSYIISIPFRSLALMRCVGDVFVERYGQFRCVRRDKIIDLCLSARVSALYI